MEKLDNPWHIYVGDDLWIWHCYPVGASMHCPSGMSSGTGRVCVCVCVYVRWLVCQWRAWLVIVSHMLMPSFPLKLTVLGLMELLSDIAILSDIVNFISQYVVNFVFPHIRLTALFS